MNWLKKLLRPLTEANPKMENNLKPEEPEIIRPTMYTCIHESGHYLASLLFPNEIRINELNVNKSQINPEWNGQLHLTRTTLYESNDDAEKLMLVFSAGMVATTLFSYGEQYVHNNFSKFPHDAKLLHSVGGDDDYVMIKNLSTKVGYDRRFFLQPTYVMWNGFQAIFNYLMEPVIWSAVELIAKTLFESEAMKMSHNEIQTLLSNNNKTAEINKAINLFLRTRYPLTKAKLSRII